MSEGNPTANQIFRDALEITSVERRHAFVEQACGDDAKLRQDVEALLNAHQESPGGSAAVLADAKKTTPFAPASGEFDETTLGPYQLRGLIAEGGMGVVYEAYQEEPVRRTVALKIIKPGMDSRDVIARFEIERQTLALMDHPNIASVLDAGSTQWGHPYFVMELVRGTPITTHCDVHRLSIRERLQTVHAGVPRGPARASEGHHSSRHQTVQCAGHDERRLARAEDHRLRCRQSTRSAVDRADASHAVFPNGRHTAVHESGTVVARQSGCRHAERRLLAGSLAVRVVDGHDALRCGSARQGDLRRVSSHQERRRTPAAKCACDVADENDSWRRSRASAASQPARLTQSLRGELDWIVMKALDKDRQRRYQTARGLAADVRRYLDNEPVEAGPPTTMYLTRKFVSRHRGLIAAASLISLALIVGYCGERVAGDSSDQGGAIGDAAHGDRRQCPASRRSRPSAVAAKPGPGPVGQRLVPDGCQEV